MKKQQTLILVLIVAIVVVGVLSFYGGIKYGQSQNRFSPRNLGQFNGQNMKQNVNNMIGGEIISMDDKSLTVKLRDNGSKIIFFSGSTTLSKTVDGAVSDLKIGEQVNINGISNSDGSISAKSIQIRPAITNTDGQLPPNLETIPSASPKDTN